LLGIDPTEFPARVTTRQPESCPATGQEHVLLGLMSWQLPAQHLPTLNGSHEVVVFTRRRALVSTGRVSFATADVDVELGLATLVVLRWRSRAASRPVVTVVGNGRAMVVSMRRDVLLDSAGREEIAWIAEVAARGKATPRSSALMQRERGSGCDRCD
jgi:hypothetical protein